MEYTYIHNHQSQFIEMFGKVDSISTLENALSETFPGEWGNEPSSTNTIKVIRTTNFTNEGRLDLSEVIEREIDSKKVSRKKLKKGDTILERSGGTKDNPVGRVVFFDEEGDYLFNNFTQVLRPKEDVNPVYLFYTLYNSYNLNKAAMRAMASQTTGIQNLSMTEYLSKQIKLPSRELQDQFEEIYRQADKSKFDGFKSQFLEWFGDFDKSEWPNMTFTEFAKIDAQMTSDFDSYSEYPHIGIESIQQNTGHILNYKTVKEDAVQSGKYVFTSKHIIYSKIRPNLNKVATPDFDGLCSADAYPILPKFKVVRKEFLAFILRSSIFLDYIIPFSRRTGMPKVNREQVEGFQLHMPPLPLQDEFLTISNQADKSKYYVQNKQNYICHILTNQIQ